ncbi:MAG TPA: serine/threonine-protein kinase, partial [Ktedonobacterales bacterium]
MSGDWNPNELLGTQLGSCVLERTLGVGGMGAVYLAQQIRPRRQVAVKVLQPGRSAGSQAWQVFLERFRREADIAAGLDHANIVPIYEFGEDGDIAFLVMPYLPDGSLSDLLLQAGRLPLSDALTYTEQVAAALDYAHAHALVHRDVKPSNLLLHADGRLMLADFGIACSVDDTASGATPRAEESGTATGSALPAGTPEYMAPEQVRGGGVTPATDIYALGIVTYAMLTGETPFGGVAPHMILARQLHEPPPSVRTLRPDLSQRLDETLNWALAKDPVARPQSALSFARALRSAAARSHPLSGLFARSGAVQAPRGMLKMASSLTGRPGRSSLVASHVPSSSPIAARRSSR